MQYTEFVPQFMIPAEPETSWAGGQFFGKDRFIIWTLVKKQLHFFYKTLINPCI